MIVKELLPWKDYISLREFRPLRYSRDVKSNFCCHTKCLAVDENNFFSKYCQEIKDKPNQLLCPDHSQSYPLIKTFMTVVFIDLNPDIFQNPPPNVGQYVTATQHTK